LAIIAFLASALFAPIAVNAKEQVLAAEPATITNQVPSDARWAPERVAAPATSTEASRMIAAQRALQSGDLGSMQEEALAALVASNVSWGATSGYDALEANRVAASGLISTARSEASCLQEYAISTSPSVSATWGETSGYNVLEANRVAASMLIAQSVSGSDLGATDKAAAEHLAQFRAVELSLGSSLGPK
jgi:hypothetical protein